MGKEDIVLFDFQGVKDGESVLFGFSGCALGRGGVTGLEQATIREIVEKAVAQPGPFRSPSVTLSGRCSEDPSVNS